MRVRVYRNLNNGCLSITSMEGSLRGKVVAHASSVDLQGCKMVVSEPGRQRVLREKVKGVHAWVEGTLIQASHIRVRYDVQISESPESPVNGLSLIRYNPYLFHAFFRSDDGSEVWSADRVRVRTDGVWA